VLGLVASDLILDVLVDGRQMSGENSTNDRGPTEDTCVVQEKLVVLGVMPGEGSLVNVIDN
jgi:hypothetical protein